MDLKMALLDKFTSLSSKKKMQNKLKRVGYLAWLGINYGSNLQGYALYSSIKKLGYDCEIIGAAPFLNDQMPDGQLRSSNPKRYDHQRTAYNFTVFMKRHFVFNQPLGVIPGDCFLEQDQIEEVSKFDAFVCGSDQIWKPGAFWFAPRQYLQFAPTFKRVSYAPSVGWKQVPEQFKVNLENWKKWLSSVPFLSCREKNGSRLISEVTGRTTTTVVDPTMLLTPDEWMRSLAEPKYAEEVERILNSGQKFILAYFLDHEAIFRDKIEKFANDQALAVIWLTGRDNYGPIQKNCTDTDPAGFVNLISRSQAVFADGFHGTCFALNFSKPVLYFSASKVPSKSNDVRVEDLFERMGITAQKCIVTEDTELKSDILNMDFREVQRNIARQRNDSIEYLKKSLGLCCSTEFQHSLKTTSSKGDSLAKSGSKLSQFSCNGSELIGDRSLINDNFENYLSKLMKVREAREKLFKNPDFVKIRILGSLLKDYNIRHVVLSPGGRDAPLVRMFENNQHIFQLHRITDERSAAYFGLGLAAQLKQPVACVCTSGTAVSNYVPAVTEAYFTGVPLIVVTADRYVIYHNQGEDQTIPQDNVFRDVVKKAITVPEGSGESVEYQTRRDISDCILETVHNVFGPVHINIAIGDVNAGNKIPQSFWKLPSDMLYPHLQRVTSYDSDAKMVKWVDALKRSKRILLIYGQNAPLNETQRKDVITFTDKYNCVVLTDHLSNFHCDVSLNTFSMLRKMKQFEFDKLLTPDIVITVGGKSLMNDPITFKLREGRKNIRHWGVNPSGQIRDLYFRQSSILEMSQEFFFRYFSSHAGNIKNDKNYFNAWENENSKYQPPVLNNFTSNFVQSCFLPTIPKNSILHLGVGLSFYDCRYYPIEESVEVFCNMGTNGIDGCTSTFLGQCAIASKNRKCFLLVGDLSFFYDMNSIWNKELNSNIRILMVNNNGSGLLRGHNLKGITSEHNTSAKGWVESTGFKYISATDRETFKKELEYFVSDDPDRAVFFEIFCH